MPSKRKNSRKKSIKKRSLHECPYCRSGLGSKCYGKKYPCKNAVRRSFVKNK